MADLEKVIIIKGLEEWINANDELDTKIDACLVADALDLLKEQQVEIDRLKSEQPKKGHWKKSTYADDRWHECSECGKVTEKVDKNGNKLICNFCRICGADMRKDGEQE